MYKLLDNIMLICRDEDHRKSTEAMQAYLVDPSNKSQLKNARTWGSWTEYGPRVKTESGKWRYEWEKEHEPLEFTFENKNFGLELLDCAGGSSQGGKLSFWNCIVTRDDKRFKIGINSEMLLEVLKNATFVNGVCQGDLRFVTDNGKVGMCTEGSEIHKNAIKDMELKAAVKSKSVNKFSFGDFVETPTLKEIYLGTVNQYYVFDPGERNATYHHSYFDYRYCTLTKLAKPITYHIFDSVYGNKTKVSEYVDNYGPSHYSYPDFKKTCPKRVISGKLELDYTEKEFKEKLFNKMHDFVAFEEYAKGAYLTLYQDRILYYFLSKQTFGFGFEPFEISDDIMNKIKAAGINYVDESEHA